MTLCHDVFLIPRLLIFSYKQMPAPSEAGNTSAESRPQLPHSSLSLCPYESEPHVRMGAQAGCHCHYRSGGEPTILKRVFPWHSAEFCWSSLTRLAESLLPPSHIYRSLFRGRGVRKLAACQFLPAPVLLHTDVLIFDFQATLPLRDIIIISRNISSVKRFKKLCSIVQMFDF